jgi:flagellar motor switch protein FliN/FliY
MTDSMQDALVQLGETLAEAVLGALQDAVGDDATAEEVVALLDYGTLTSLVRPGMVVVDASSVDGSVGRALLTLDRSTARMLLAGRPPEGAETPDGDQPDTPPAAAEDGPELATAELARLADLGDQLNAAATEALGSLLGQQLRYEVAQASPVEDPRFIVRPGAVQAICTTFAIRGQQARMIQFAPNALVMRAARAFEELAQDTVHPLAEAGAGPSEEALGTMRLRVWAELGRTELGLADALALPLGAVVELEEDADAPIDLMVNGMRFGTGRLIVTDDGEWAMVLDEIDAESVARVASG